MTTSERILAARCALEKLTPMKCDCGRTCGAACCHADEDGNGGMVLFPGEEAFYSPCPDWARLTPSQDFPGQYLFVCNGTCERSLRPLACRIFPLTPRVRHDEATVELDVRAWPVCPLMECGLEGMDGAFVAAVREATALLWEDKSCREYIEALSDYLAQFENF